MPQIISVIILVLLIIAVYRKTKDLGVPIVVPLLIAIGILMLGFVMAKGLTLKTGGMAVIKIAFAVIGYFVARLYARSKAKDKPAVDKTAGTEKK